MLMLAEISPGQANKFYCDKLHTYKNEYSLAFY